MVLYYDFGNGDYEFEPSYNEIQDALKEILTDMSEKELLEVLDDKQYENCTKEELIEIVLDTADADCFRDELWEYFESIARGDYEENLEWQRDKYSYYGLRESDFH